MGSDFLMEETGRVIEIEKKMREFIQNLVKEQKREELSEIDCRIGKYKAVLECSQIVSYMPGYDPNKAVEIITTQKILSFGHVTIKYISLPGDVVLISTSVKL